MNRDKLFATIVTALTILFVSLLLLFVFKSKSDNVSKHFISKRGEAIAVSLASSSTKKSSKANIHKRTKVKKKRYHKKIKKHKTRVKHKKPIKHKKIVKQKNKTTHKVKKTNPVKNKKIEAKKLFSSITDKSSLNKNSVDKKEGEGRGEINRYLAKIEKRLRSWPAQRDFAGEEIDVRLKIYPNGKFDYKIMKYSRNSEFNNALISYLDDLKRFGFGPHKGGRAYEIEVEFIAHN